MGNKKLIFVLLTFVFLSGCIESASLMGPTLTVATTGNMNQAAFAYGSNKIIQQETGKTFLGLVEHRFQKTRQKLFLNKKLTTD